MVSNGRAYARHLFSMPLPFHVCTSKLFRCYKVKFYRFRGECIRLIEVRLGSGGNTFDNEYTLINIIMHIYISLGFYAFQSIFLLLHIICVLYIVAI